MSIARNLPASLASRAGHGMPCKRGISMFAHVLRKLDPHLVKASALPCYLHSQRLGQIQFRRQQRTITRKADMLLQESLPAQRLWDLTQTANLPRALIEEMAPRMPQHAGDSARAASRVCTAEMRLCARTGLKEFLSVHTLQMPVEGGQVDTRVLGKRSPSRRLEPLASVKALA